ncbi:MAG: hypothetical protein CVV42_18075 [Candidatus Riflebacteria bacterium HGW-Riflebacteria-2]|jgi:hemerythrin-like metal-binding protein|nr:MAG: hypothetical protein CVV42_18075 [Candidatus Riflebacteria bacterium HGW-Riflebacteria-2]
MQWSDEFNVGCPGIDAQHKELVEKVNELERLLACGEADDENFSDAILFVVEYARTHFRDEEELMQKMQYPGFVAHRKLHDQMVNHLANFLKDMQSGNGGTFSELVSYLYVWIQAHVLIEDRKFGDYYSLNAEKGL